LVSAWRLIADVGFTVQNRPLESRDGTNRSVDRQRGDCHKVRLHQEERHRGKEDPAGVHQQAADR